jgi:hypothetical protein
VNRIAAMMPSMTQSSFASGKTIEGLLPPSSSETGTMRDARFGAFKPFLDVAAHFPELLFVDDSADVACLIKGITELESLHFPWSAVSRPSRDR